MIREKIVFHDAGNLADVREFIDSRFKHKKIQRVLFVVPPDSPEELFKYATAKRGRYPNYPPYGEMLLAKHLAAANVESQILDLNCLILKVVHQSLNESNFNFSETWQSTLKQKLDEFKPDLVCVTCMFTMTHLSLKRVCEVLSLYHCQIACGGVHISNDVDRVLDDIQSISFAFIGEGDNSLLKFIETVNRDDGKIQLQQVVINDKDRSHIKSKNGRMRFSGDNQPSETVISEIPRYDLIEIADYSRVGTIGAFYCFKPKDTIFATVLSNRGCRAQCTFCSVRNFNGAGVRQRSVKSVADELEFLVTEKNVGHIMWLDDDLFKDEYRWIALCNEIKKRKLSFTWDATNGLIASCITPEIMQASYETGCIAVNIGMESGNAKILRDVKKPGTVKNFIRAAEVLRYFEGIHSSVFLMIGFPGESLQMIFDTVKVAVEMDLDWYRISQLQPLPNTPIYDSMVEQGLLSTRNESELRFMGGGYGKQTEIEQGIRQSSLNFLETFNSIPRNGIPTGDQLTDIWFYMNYHLNFQRIFNENRRTKVDQLMKHLRVLGDVISPENAFSLYFLGFLQHKFEGSIDPSVIERLDSRIETSPYWQDRFNAFGLKTTDLKTLKFENQYLPSIKY